MFDALYDSLVAAPALLGVSWDFREAAPDVWRMCGRLSRHAAASRKQSRSRGRPRKQSWAWNESLRCFADSAVMYVMMSGTGTSRKVFRKPQINMLLRSSS